MSGEYGGRLIKTPDGMATRPTSQNVREALFNILAPVIAGAVFVDLFAGSGAVGIEALSRGARAAVFVDNGRASAGAVRGNLKALGIDGSRALVLGADLSRLRAYQIIKSSLAKLGAESADIAFADPPYGYPGLAALPGDAAGAILSAAGGLLVVEHSSKTGLPPAAGLFEAYSVKKYGDAGLTFYRGAGAGVGAGVGIGVGMGMSVGIIDNAEDRA